MTDLYNILGDGVNAGERPEEGAGLLIDMSGGTTKVGMYLDALCDMNQIYSAYEETPDMEHTEPEAVEALRLLARMGGIEQVQYVPEDGDPYVRARWFAQGLGRAYIGYSEAMSVMGDAISSMEFRPFSYTEKDNIPLLSGDVVGIRSTIEDDKKELAFDLLNILTGEEAMTAAFSPNETHAEPQYLLPARLSVYDALAASFPAYAGLREIVLDPGNCLYRIGPDAREFISRAKRVLPGIIFGS